MMAAVGIATAGFLGLQAEPSQAEGRDGKCEPGEFCYYYNSGNAGSVSDFTGSLDNYGSKQPGCYEFKGTGNGKGKCVKNAAASVWNRTDKTVRVYYNSNYAGAYQDFAPGTSGNLSAAVKNNNASHKFLEDLGVPEAGGGESGSPAVAQFYDLTKGKVWPNVDGTHAGQCVSLVSKYMNWMFGIGQVYGNARDYRPDLYTGKEMARLGFTWSTSATDLRDGDILVWDHTPYGHIGIWYNGQVYHQNWGTKSAQLTPLSQVNASKPYAGRWRKG